MKTLTKQALSLVCFTAAFFSGSALATSSTTQGGVIHFVGAIVEDPCNIAANTRHIAMSCYRAGQVKTSTISYQQASTGKPVDNDVAAISMHYLNTEKTLGIVMVDYK
ncbi:MULTISPECIES: type 1 fimbrial protein [Enterobacterales]|uniref:type 1 fimbrial protein n=1 Tax=Enterobacterales TaxID=91347 RepID=UPI002ED98112